jgi:hypothetical protein
MEVLVLRLTLSQEAGQERDKPITVPLQQLKHKRLLARISHENLKDVESLVPAKRIARRVAGVSGMYGCADSLGTREEASNTRSARGKQFGPHWIEADRSLSKTMVVFKCSGSAMKRVITAKLERSSNSSESSLSDWRRVT